MRIKTVVFASISLAAIVGGYAYRDTLLTYLSSPDAKAPGGDVAASGGGGQAGSGAAGRGRRGGQALPVLVGKVEMKASPRRLAIIGSAQAFATVSVKSRVDGQILEAHFKEGDTVKAGDLLFRIDPRPFQVSLRQAQANLERDRAQAAKAKGDVDRYQSLVGKGFTSQQKYEEAKATYGALQGTIRAAEAAIEGVKLQLEYTTIRSPIDGRTGSLLVNTGNLVKANDTQPLVVITQLKPIYVTFSVPERYLVDIKKLMATSTVSVEARLPGSSSLVASGRLVFVNNAVDTNTGTIQLKAEFDNAQNEFTPGQFVNVAMTLEERPNALVIPSQALQEGQRGSFVFVMKQDRTVELRPVKVDDVVGDLTVITSGLAAGEDVVLDGQLQLRPGARVSVRTPDGRPQGGRPEGAGRERKRPDAGGEGAKRGKRQEVGGNGEQGGERPKRRAKKEEGA